MENNKKQDETEEVIVAEEVLAIEKAQPKPILLWIAIVVLLCLFAGGAWYAQQQLQKQQLETSNLAKQFAAGDQLSNQLSNLKQASIKEATATQQRLAELNTADVALVEKLEAVTQAQQLTNDDVLRTWALAEVKFLLNTANHSVLLAGDLEKAQTALSLADQQLQSLSDPRLHALRALLADDQLALSSVKKVDVAGLAVQLQSAINNVDRLQVLMGPAVDTAAADDEPVTESSLPDSLQSAASSAWEQVKSLVVIRHQEDADAALLVPEQRYFLYQNLQLKLESARLALLSGEESIFHASLASATEWLQQYYVGEERDAMLEMLQKMQLQTIKVELPDISASLIWLQQYGDQ